MLKIFIAQLAMLSTLSLDSVASEKPANWNQQMLEVSKALGEALPLLYPSSDKNPKLLTEKISKLHDLTDQLDIESAHIISQGDYDPALTYFANSFKDDVDRAYISLKEGHTEFAKQSLRNTTAYCIGCHTRTESGKVLDLKYLSEPLKKAPWVERMQFLAAGRQFNQAFNEVIKELQKPKSQSMSSLDLEKGARLALTIAVRVNQDPAQAMKLVDAVMISKNTSPFTKQDAGKWKDDIEKWKGEKKRPSSSPEELIQESEKLIKSAQGSKGRSDVNLLRASALLHKFIRTYPGNYERTDAYFLLGQAYNGLVDLDLGSLQEIYFKACIQDRPHSDLSEKCFKRLEESNILGYTGTTGFQLPPNVKLRLRDLKEKATKLKEY